MAFDINRATFSGEILNFRQIQTKTGTPMIAFTLQCFRERVSVVAFKDLASSTALTTGERVVVKGRIQSRSYEKDGVTHYSWQLIADSIEVEASTTAKEETPVTEEPATQPNLFNEPGEHSQRPVAVYHPDDPF